MSLPLESCRVGLPPGLRWTVAAAAPLLGCALLLGCSGTVQVDPAEQLIADLRQASAASRLRAAQEASFLEYQSPSLCDALLGALRDGDPGVRAAAARALEKTEDANKEKVLIALDEAATGEQDSSTKSAMLAALDKLRGFGGPPVTPP